MLPLCLEESCTCIEIRNIMRELVYDLHSLIITYKLVLIFICNEN